VGGEPSLESVLGFGGSQAGVAPPSGSDGVNGEPSNSKPRPLPPPKPPRRQRSRSMSPQRLPRPQERRSRVSLVEEAEAGGGAGAGGGREDKRVSWSGNLPSPPPRRRPPWMEAGPSHGALATAPSLPTPSSAYPTTSSPRKGSALDPRSPRKRYVDDCTAVSISGGSLDGDDQASAAGAMFRDCIDKYRAE
jgi:hypothetical protein